MFRDELTFQVLGGKGGDGLVSFLRERSRPRGGPDGGDGGRGGSVVLEASGELNSLLALGRRRRYAASKGAPGGSSECTGRNGQDLVLQVPEGTQVFDAERGNLLRDLDQIGVRVVVARGGEGGRGNASFKTSVRQAPRRAMHGREGERRSLRLELKLLAEVGLVGLPNAGKSTFLSRVSAARPKIADYPFTTLEPGVGLARVGDHDTLLIADLPGLIEGAAEGHGLGHRFLRHVERCGVLVHLVDVSDDGLQAPAEAWRVVREELEKSSRVLSAKPVLVAASKCEDEPSRERAEELERAVGGPVVRLSSVTGLGVEDLLLEAWRVVRGVETA